MRGLSWCLCTAGLTLIGCTDTYSGTLITGESSSFTEDSLTQQDDGNIAGETARTGEWQPEGDLPELVDGTWLAGNFGRSRSFSQQPTSIDAGFWPDSFSVTLHATGNHGWTMMGLRLPGVLGEGDLVPGNTVYLSGDAAGGTDVVVGGSVNGCTGPSQGQPRVDETTDDVVITFSENERGDLVLEIVSDYSDGSALDGTLVLR